MMNLNLLAHFWYCIFGIQSDPDDHLFAFIKKFFFLFYNEFIEHERRNLFLKKSNYTSTAARYFRIHLEFHPVSLLFLSKAPFLALMSIGHIFYENRKCYTNEECFVFLVSFSLSRI